MGGERGRGKSLVVSKGRLKAEGERIKGRKKEESQDSYLKALYDEEKGGWQIKMRQLNSGGLQRVRKRVKAKHLFLRLSVLLI